MKGNLECKREAGVVCDRYRRERQSSSLFGESMPNLHQYKSESSKRMQEQRTAVEDAVPRHS